MMKDALKKTINLTNDGVFYTIQGEGRYIGVPSVFIRLSGCNLRCAWALKENGINLCDTAYSSHFPEKNIESIEEIIKDCQKYSAQHIVITGGEPFMQSSLDFLINSLDKINKFITIETNGTIYRPTRASFISLSPKLASSCHPNSKYEKVHHRLRLNLHSLSQFIDNHEFQLKFVINTAEDFNEIENLINNINTKKGKDYVNKQVYLMPQGVNTKQIDEKLPWIIEECKKRDWKLSDRLHIRIWGQRRAV